MPASMLPSISILSSSIFVVRCPVTLGSWNVISLSGSIQVMEITNVPGAQAGSIPLASLVVVMVPYRVFESFEDNAA